MNSMDLIHMWNTLHYRMCNFFSINLLKITGYYSFQETRISFGI